MKSSERNTETISYKVIAIVILIIGGIGGIVLGNVFPILDDWNEEIFNTYIMLFIWVTTFCFDIFIYAIHSICYRLDLLIDKNS